MTDLNPYKPPEVIPRQPLQAPTRSSKGWGLVGFLIGAAIPVVFGTYSMWADTAYNASLPEHARCGMGGLAMLMALVIGVPLLGSVGALIGFGLSKLPRGL